VKNPKDSYQRVKKIYINGRFLCQPKTGVQRYCESFLHALDCALSSDAVLEFRHVFLVVPNSAQIEGVTLHKIKILKHGCFEGHLWEQLELPRVVNDGVLLCMANSAPFISLLLSRVKILVVIHSIAYKYVPQSYSWLYRKFYDWLMTPLIVRHASIVVTVSESEEQAILKFYPQMRSKLKVINIGGLSSQSLSAPNLNLHHLSISASQRSTFEKIDFTEKSFILFVGSLAYGKNIHGTLKAYQHVRESGIDSDLVIVGASSSVFSSTETAFSRLTSPGSQNSIHFLGQIDDINALIWLYRRAFCLLFPSFYESSGLPPIEAMTCGCPVIVSDIPVLRERCADAALYCNPHSPQDIASKVATLVTNPFLRQRLKVLGIERAQRFSWQKCAEEMMAVISANFGLPPDAQASDRP
jgi:glycosyltransferase involved in cell wall biosynthesis